MTEKFLEIINKSFHLSEKETGEYGRAKVSGMTFVTKAYEAKGLGSVSLMKGSGFMGLMKMDTLIINPFEIDMPLLSYDRILAMGNDTLIAELYETRLDKSAECPVFCGNSASLDGIPDKEKGPRWYDPILLDGSISKKGRKKDSAAFDSWSVESLKKYIESAENALPCDRQAKIKAASVYTEGLLDNGGASTDVFVKAKGREYTEKLFREFLFGTGTPDVKEKI